MFFEKQNVLLSRFLWTRRLVFWHLCRKFVDKNPNFFGSILEKKIHNRAFFRNFSPQKFQCTLRMQVNSHSENIPTNFSETFCSDSQDIWKNFALKKVFPASRIYFWRPCRIFCSNFKYFLLKFRNKKLLAFFPKKVTNSCSSGHADCSFYNHLKLFVKNSHIFARLLKIILKYYIFRNSFPWKTSSRRGISFWPCRKSFLWSPTDFFCSNL